MPTSPVSLGLLAMYAEDMYTDGSLNPTTDPRIAAAGWEVAAYLTANDVLIPDPDDPHQRLGIDLSKRVFYGFLARSKTDPTSFVVVVRGTDGLVEWLIDAEFLLVRHPSYPATQVEQGFWGIYQTMNLADPATGATTYAIATQGIAATVGAGTVTITGHSLGSALATYLTLDVAVKLGPRATACLFASPRTGDAAWAALFDSTVTSYQLYNYILDVVTHVPTLGYATLPKVTLLQPSAAQAHIRLDVFCNHHVICYCAMIDYAAAMAAPTVPGDVKCKLCITPPPMSQAARGLADVIDDFGVGDDKALAMLNALHTISLASS
jgi:triacylglycerol lipase